MQEKNQWPAACLEAGLQHVQSQPVDVVHKPGSHAGWKNIILQRRQLGHFYLSVTLWDRPSLLDVVISPIDQNNFGNRILAALARAASPANPPPQSPLRGGLFSHASTSEAF
jgi:hypothetical protein